MAWDETPPTAEELQGSPQPVALQPASAAPSWDAAPPTEVEINPPKKIPLWDLMGHMRATAESPLQTAQDAALGTAQGVSLGTADEIEGAIKASVDAAISGREISPFNEDFLKKYREFQKQSQKKYKEAEERSPFAYGSSELASGFLAPVPGMGALGVGKTLGKGAISQALKQGGKVELAGELATLAAKDAVKAAPVGAVMGAGYSEGGIETPEGRSQLLKDIGFGAGTAGVVGGVIGVGASTLPYAAEKAAAKVGKIIDSDNVYREFKNAYDYGKQGVNFGIDETQRVWFGKAAKEADDIFQVLEKADEGFGKEINRTIQEAEQKGISVNLEPQISDAFNKLEKYANTHQTIDLSPVKRFVDKLGINGNNLSPTEAVQFKRELDLITQKISESKYPIPDTISDIFYQLKSKINNSIGKQVPGFTEANKAFAKNRELIFGQILAGDQAPSLVGNAAYYGNLKNPELGVQNKIIEMIHGTTKEGAGSREAKSAFQALSESLKRASPKTFEFMGMSGDELLNKIKTAADRDALIQDITKTAPQHGIPSSVGRAVVGGIGGTGKSYALKISNKAGLYGGKIVNILGSPLTMTKKAFYDMPLDMAESVANVLATHENAQIKHMGEALSKAIADKDQVGRNAVLFSIMQNPNTRNMFNFTDEEKK